MSSSSGGPAPACQTTLATVLDRANTDEARARFRAQGDAVWFHDLLDAQLLAPLLEDLERVRPRVNRNFVPGRKKGGSVSYFDLRASAPHLVALYHDPAFIGFLESLTGERLVPCPERDPHACALYFYTEAGDHIGWHYDTSFYRGKRFTILLGLVDRSTSILQCVLNKRTPDATPHAVEVATRPGTLVVFDGDKLWHAVSPLGEGEERISLALEYVTDRHMGVGGRIISAVKDSVGYFGLKSLWRGAR